MPNPLIGMRACESKENVDSGARGPIYAPLAGLAILEYEPQRRLTEFAAMADATTTLDLADRTREADTPHSPVVHFAADTPLQIAYQTYGTLNAKRTNAVLACHALTGDQHVVNTHPVTGKPGWWETMV